MGLAASQARLLSITSRLSDNELRTQLINNSKMRLATESSRVSEDYINALNSATMMMTNYDMNGHEQTQALTFNALTAYSPSNKQYGLVDSNGRILVNGKDGKNFEDSNGDLDTFLASYGLEYTTSYFNPSTFGDWYDPDTKLVDLQMKNDKGQMEPYASYSPDELKAMYLGGKVGNETYSSYDSSLMSTEYLNYQEKYAEYDTAITDYVNTYWEALGNKVSEELNMTNPTIPEKTYNDCIEPLKQANTFKDLPSFSGNLTKYIGQLKDLAVLYSTDTNFINYFSTTTLNKMGYTIEGSHVWTTVNAPKEAIITSWRNDYPEEMKVGGHVDKDENIVYDFVITDYAGTPGYIVDFKPVDGQENIDLKFFGALGRTDNSATDNVAYTVPTGFSNKKSADIINETIKVSGGGNTFTGMITKIEGDVATVIYDDDGEYVDDKYASKTYYVRLGLSTNDSGETLYSLGNGANVYSDPDCQTKYDDGSHVWDHNAGQSDHERYTSGHWYNLQNFQYTNNAGDLFRVKLSEAPGKNCSSKIEQTVYKAVIGEELNQIASVFEEYFALHVIDNQKLFDINSAETIMDNCGVTVDLDALRKIVFKYLDSILDGRDENGDFRNTDFNNLYEELWNKHADKIGDIKWVLAYFKNHSNYQHLVENNETFNAVKSVGIMEQLFNTFGEPKMGWIDTDNNNTDGTKKAEWYTNLFNRMKQGYKQIEPGLASSNEWVQYALESGLATVVQVDRARNWVGAGYKNIKEITEVVDDKAVAIAEAEYNKAMQDIENKDKRFDMELKNIDTEHNALQQEYETIKSVISKNVERTFKIYS